MPETNRSVGSDHHDEWSRQLDKLEQNLNTVRAEQTMFEELVEAINLRAGDTPATWRDHYARLYVAAQGMAVRRMIRGGPDEVSMGRLLESVAEHADEVTADYLVGLAAERGASELLRASMTDYFRTHWGNGGLMLDPAIPRRDRQRLFVENRAAIDWADATIAHILADGEPIPFTFGDLKKAIEHTRSLFIQYCEILTGVHKAIDLMAIHPSWVTTFDRPLFPPPGEVWKD